MGGDMVTERLRLRPLAPADAPRIRLLAGDLAVARWLARVPHPYPDGEAERFITRSCEDDGHDWAIDARVDSGLIGVIGIDRRESGESLGYWLGVPYWGRGYASEAARAAVGWAFAEGGLDCLASGAFQGNDASLRVQEKLGFQITGQRMLHCKALGVDRLHIDTALSHAKWEAQA